MAVEVRSYRSVFALERRIYSIDRLRLNPTGVPVRGVVYYLALLPVALLAASLPLLGALVEILPWYLRDLALPAAVAGLLTAVRVEGRPFHLAAWTLVCYACKPRRRAAGRRWSPAEIVVFPDGSENRLRRLRCTGPGAVKVAVAHERIEWRNGRLARLGGRPRLAVRELAGRRPPPRLQRIVLREGTRMNVEEAVAEGRARR